MSKPKEKIIVKKVAAFPFPAQLKIGEKVIKSEVVKIETLGFMAKTDDIVLLNKPVEFSFVFPVLNETVTGQGKTVKIYDSMPGTASKVQRFCEVHFTQLSAESRETINKFIRQLMKASK